MNEKSILLDPKRETLPIIRMGDYGFEWDGDDVKITNRKNESRTYSIDALNRISNSTGMPLAIRSMAWEALDWVRDHPKTEQRTWITKEDFQS
jgi:hypothetical protein